MLWSNTGLKRFVSVVVSPEHDNFWDSFGINENPFIVDDICWKVCDEIQIVESLKSDEFDENYIVEFIY